MTAPSPITDASRTDNLALIFQEVLTVIVRLRCNRQELSDAESFRDNMRETITTAIQEARNHGYSPEDIKMTTLALAGFLDESVLETHNPLFAEWSRKPFQEELFGTHIAGEQFFQNVDLLLARPDSIDLADLLELHYLCLLLGYGGRYSVGGRGELEVIKRAIAAKIHRIYGASPGPFLEFKEESEIPPLVEDPWVKRLIVGALGCFVLLVVLFTLFKIALSSGLTNLELIIAPVNI